MVSDISAHCLSSGFIDDVGCIGRQCFLLVFDIWTHCKVLGFTFEVGFGIVDQRKRWERSIKV